MEPSSQLFQPTYSQDGAAHTERQEQMVSDGTFFSAPPSQLQSGWCCPYWKTRTDGFRWNLLLSSSKPATVRMVLPILKDKNRWSQTEPSSQLFQASYSQDDAAHTERQEQMVSDRTFLSALPSQLQSGWCCPYWKTRTDGLRWNLLLSSSKPATVRMVLPILKDKNRWSQMEPSSQLFQACYSQDDAAHTERQEQMVSDGTFFSALPSLLQSGWCCPYWKTRTDGLRWNLLLSSSKPATVRMMLPILKDKNRWSQMEPSSQLFQASYSQDDAAHTERQEQMVSDGTFFSALPSQLQSGWCCPYWKTRTDGLRWNLLLSSSKPATVRMMLPILKDKNRWS